jgi:hypothetical protein
LKFSPLIRLHTDKDVFFCSGFVVSKNYAVTAAHCVYDLPKKRPSIKIYDENNKNTDTKVAVAASDGQMDFALLVGDFSKFNAVLVDDSMLNITNTIFSKELLACGFPNGGRKSCSIFKPNDPYYFEVSGFGMFYPGMSGGPVIDTSTGQVVGLNSVAIKGGVLVTPLIEIFSALNVRNEPN